MFYVGMRRTEKRDDADAAASDDVLHKCCLFCFFLRILTTNIVCRVFPDLKT